MSESYKDRMINEYRETKERYEKLHRMIVKYEAGRLEFVPDCSLELLKRQAKAMGEYLYILEVRAEIEEVALVDESPTFSRALNYLTADAIPIEWINEWVNNYCDREQEKLIECLLRTWNKNRRGEKEDAETD